jgi:hypothetical protein
MKKLLKEYWLLIVFGVVGLIFVLFPYDTLDGFTIWGFQLNTKKYNELGDFVGGITAPILSMIALVLLYLTYRSQKEELAESRKILTKQTETLDKQQFETTLFNMLNLHHEIVKSIDLIKKSPTLREMRQEKAGLIEESPKQTEYGRDCFRSFYAGFKNEYLKVKTENQLHVYKEIINLAYDNYFKRHQSDLGHYFRNLYHIFKLIKRSTIKNKKEYASLVRAQLSSHELLMLFYNGLADHGEKFKPLIEEFHILKNMPFDDLILKQHMDLYLKSAFEKTEGEN